MPNLSEKEKDKIKKDAKILLDNFASALDKVKIKAKKSESIVGGFREEGSDKPENSDFRDRMFANAPKKNKDNIIAETKKW